MSRTDKTKPFWVKLLHNDLHWVEEHDHTDGVCDLPDVRDGVAFTYGTTHCRRAFVFTGTRTCCCRLCSADAFTTSRRKRQRLDGRKAARNWRDEY